MLENLSTEHRNEKTTNLDEMSIKEVLQSMNEEDRTVALAVEKEIEHIEKVVQTVIKSFEEEGRLIYIGAGTSGRLGILDAVECPPTFGTDDKMVQGFIAGGLKAFTKAVEGAEDREELAEEDLKSIGLNEKDTVIGIAASGRTPYVIGGLKYAHSVGASTASISCNKNAEISKYAKLNVEVETGAEILTGSTRLKAGTAQKLVLNMISTASMIGVGKVYKNLMVDVQSTNEKLVERSKRIIVEATGVSYEVAAEYYEKANRNVKVAIVMVLLQCEYGEALEKLKEAKGFVKKAL
ncbi:MULTISPECIES: N-acetylmuramic acid 6-phosphate etherase [Bacillus]|jgi:N-acetylmuramic acid 6-phosphate etherase|uniref:N-acetylmuramic acid 6-phosphate etherase n=1 Tax=Bacillus toyonensis TaxID=155322 RepID=A0AAP8F5W8_9BACI|nr:MULTISPECIES: N-acetylmuramic acid 6-phosphate etherase [Bacillus]EOP29238.1 N-acetylmuramic acid 6-phosphate etherase [Bacillus cereus VD131]KNH40821.1 N-acetylmuramic acid-6-phosphate etherase [Bacillus thuringiensis]KXY48191.1 N-acetylmuramic acid 6-phosphate etherase [Bacillus cereus]OTX29064.1 N-acetylmuramic acid 6-phosphate etherase [Bacillus thuringiensis serovar malayensis]OUB02800.1 N-acetylmuramic acid 6-phosphate etherase [Bacillus thuringiensis serovar shandongiensis]